MKPKTTVLGAMTIVTVLTTVAGIRRGTLNPKWLVGLAATTVMLLMLTEAAPEVATGMAVLLLLATVIGGQEGIEGITKAVSVGRTKPDSFNPEQGGLVE